MITTEIVVAVSKYHQTKSPVTRAGLAELIVQQLNVIGEAFEMDEHDGLSTEREVIGLLARDTYLPSNCIRLSMF
jgi:hypothetical protein